MSSGAHPLIRDRWSTGLQTCRTLSTGSAKVLRYRPCALTDDLNRLFHVEHCVILGAQEDDKERLYRSFNLNQLLCNE
jgi:hypothetical protein